MAFERLKIALGFKQSQTYRALIQATPQQPIWSQWDFQKLARDGYQENVYLFACIKTIAMAVAGIDWLVYRNNAEGDLEEVDGHPLLDLIERPNPYMGRAKFFETIISYYLLHGNAPIEKTGPTNGPPKELYPLRPDRMKIVPGTAEDPIAGYIYNIGGNETRFEKEEILWLKSFSPLDDWYGFPPAMAAGRAIDQNNSAKDWNVGLLQNMARPAGAFAIQSTEFNPTATLTNDQFEDLKKRVKEQYSGPQKAGLPLILEGGMDWKEISLTPKEMDWAAAQRQSAKEIAIVFGVPPELIGDSENKTYSNWKESRKAFYEETVLPLMDWIRDELNNWLVPFYSENIYLDYDSDNIEALKEDREAVWTRVMNAWWLTLNERREAVGYESIGPDGDRIYVPMGVMPDLRKPDGGATTEPTEEETPPTEGEPTEE